MRHARIRWSAIGTAVRPHSGKPWVAVTVQGCWKPAADSHGLRLSRVGRRTCAVAEIRLLIALNLWQGQASAGINVGPGSTRQAAHGEWASVLRMLSSTPISIDPCTPKPGNSSRQTQSPHGILLCASTAASAFTCSSQTVLHSLRCGYRVQCCPTVTAVPFIC